MVPTWNISKVLPMRKAIDNIDDLRQLAGELRVQAPTADTLNRATRVPTIFKQGGANVHTTFEQIRL